MTTRKKRNLTQEQQLVKDHDGLNGLPGYIVVVFERLKNGAKFLRIVTSGERFKMFPFPSSREKLFAVAVNESVLQYSFEVPVSRDDDDPSEWLLRVDLTYRAGNPRLVAGLTDQDPLRRLIDEISRRYQSRRWEPDKLIRFAATLGIEIISLDTGRSSFESTDDLRLHRKIVAESMKRSRPAVGGDGGKAKSFSDETPDDRATDTVACSVFAPSKTRRDSNILVQVFAHLEKDEAIAKAMAFEFDEKTQRRGLKRLDHEVERGSKLVFGISMPGLKIDEPIQEMIWRGQPESVQFGVHVPKEFVADQIIGTVYVTQNSIPFGHVKFKLQIESVDAPAVQKNEPQTENTWKRYHYAFISYASPDRSEVLKRVQMLARLRIDFFQDLLTLEPGDRWEQELYKNIDRSDVFFLFWSTAARDSKWVMKEVQYALKRKGPDKSAAPEIVPVIIEGPPLVKPPDELKDIHFNDIFLYLMK